MASIVVRQAVLADLEHLVPLFDGYRQFYGCSSDHSAVRDFLLARYNHNESVLFIALQDNAPVGFAQLYPSFSSVSLARTFVLNDLFVHPDHRKQGTASQLIAAVTMYAKSLGAIRLTLSTATANFAAQKLYETLGWKRDEQFFVYHFPITN